MLWVHLAFDQICLGQALVLASVKVEGLLL